MNKFAVYYRPALSRKAAQNFKFYKIIHGVFLALDNQGQRKGFLRKLLLSIFVLPPCLLALSSIYSTKKVYRDHVHIYNFLIIYMTSWKSNMEREKINILHLLLQ